MTDALDAALRSARRLCELIENPPASERPYVEALVPTLADLIARAALLPPVEPTDVDMERSRPGDDETRKRYANVLQHLGSAGAYWTTLGTANAIDDPPEGVNLPLADDLVDTWRDVAHAVRTADGGAARSDVAWQLRFSFQSHWGRHATEALRALHEVAS